MKHIVRMRAAPVFTLLFGAYIFIPTAGSVAVGSMPPNGSNALAAVLGFAVLLVLLLILLVLRCGSRTGENGSRRLETRTANISSRAVFLSVFSIRIGRVCRNRRRPERLGSRPPFIVLLSRIAYLLEFLRYEMLEACGDQRRRLLTVSLR